LQLDYVLEPSFVSLISVHATPRLVKKALTASLADVVHAERLDTTPYDLVWRALGRTNVPAVKEPIGLLRSDGKRLTQIPWQAGKCMTWDVTVTDTLAESYIQATSSTAAPRLRA